MTRLCLNEWDMVGLKPFEQYKSLLHSVLATDGDFISACVEMEDLSVTEKEAKGCGLADLRGICWEACMIEHKFALGCFDLSYKDYLP